jgi:hypothetical protein
VVEQTDYSFRVDHLRAHREASEVVARKRGSKNQKAFNNLNIIQNNVTGIVGEMAFSSTFRIPRRLYSHPSAQYGDGGIDYRLSTGLTIDVKATRARTPTLRVYEHEKGRTDAYVLAYVPKGGAPPILVGWCLDKQVQDGREVLTQAGKVSVLKRRDLSPIAELMRLHDNGLIKFRMRSRLYGGKIFAVAVDKINECLNFDGAAMPMPIFEEMQKERLGGASDEKLREIAANWIE